jgi:hypothetical protein
MTLCIFFFPWTRVSRGIRRLFPCIVSLSLSLSKTDKAHTHGLPPDEKKRGVKPCDRRPSGYLAILPLCHDWTGVVALSFPFSPYKYQGTKKRMDEKKKKGTTKKNREKREEKGEKHKRKRRRKKHGRIEQGKGRKEKRKKMNEKRETERSKNRNKIEGKHIRRIIDPISPQCTAALFGRRTTSATIRLTFSHPSRPSLFSSPLVALHCSIGEQ